MEPRILSPKRKRGTAESLACASGSDEVDFSVPIGGGGESILIHE
jgi:hypothetical protein